LHLSEPPLASHRKCVSKVVAVPFLFRPEAGQQGSLPSGLAIEISTFRVPQAVSKIALGLGALHSTYDLAVSDTRYMSCLLLFHSTGTAPIGPNSFFDRSWK
jgi:hypothetical protein